MINPVFVICSSQKREYQRRAVQHFFSVVVSHWAGVWSKGGFYSTVRNLSYIVVKLW